MDSKVERVRPALLADYDQVMELDNDPFSGLDYLSATYTDFIQDPEIRCYVVDKGGLVLAFISMHHLAGDRTVVSIGKRVHRDHQGRGVAGRMMSDVMTDVKQTWPDVHLHTYANMHMPLHAKVRADPDSPLRIKLTWAIIGLRNTYEKTEKNMKMFNEHYKEDVKVRCPDPDTMMTILDQSDMDRLVPGGYMAGWSYWLPVASTRPNLTHLLHTHHVLCTLDETDQSCRALSMAKPVMTDSMCRYTIYYYSILQSDQIFTAHVHHHVTRMLSDEGMTSPNVGITINMVNQIKAQDDFKHIKSMFGSDVKVTWHKEGVIFEENV